MYDSDPEQIEETSGNTFEPSRKRKARRTGIKLEWLAAWFHGLSGVVLEPPAGVNLPIATKALELKPALEYVGKETLVSEDGSTRCGYRFNATMSIDQDRGGAVVPRVYRGTIFLPERQETGEEWRRKTSYHVEGTDTDHETLVSSIDAFPKSLAAVNSTNPSATHTARPDSTHTAPDNVFADTIATNGQ